MAVENVSGNCKAVSSTRGGLQIASFSSVDVVSYAGGQLVNPVKVI